MPMDRSLYPADWDDLAASLKKGVGWRCEECQRPCREPGETVEALINRLIDTIWGKDLFKAVEDDELGCVEVPAPGRFVLTVAHLDHRPENCDRSNLKALCSVCHCRYDLRQMKLKQQLKLERRGQLRLFP